MPSMEDFLPPKPDEVFDVAKGTVCDLIDGVMARGRTPRESVEKALDRGK